MTDVSVIIPVKDDSARLLVCLTALAASDYPLELLDVVVADNGSSEPLPEPPPGLRVRVVRHPQGGSYAAREAAARTSSAEVLAFTDADCVPERGWIGAAVRALRETGAAAVGGRVRLTYATGRPRGAGELYESRHAFRQEANVAQGYAVTANLVLTREAWSASGGFDTRLLSGGDYEFGGRLTRRGGTLLFRDDVVVSHPARPDLDAVLVKTERTTRGLRVLMDLGLLARPSTPAFFREQVRFCLWGCRQALGDSSLSLPDRLALVRAVLAVRLAVVRVSLTSTQLCQPVT